MKNLYFYTTAGCSLCDQAENILRSLSGVDAFGCEIVDIVESDELIDQYGTRIPVIRDQESQEEMSWPFSQEQVSNWLNKLSNHVEKPLKK